KLGMDATVGAGFGQVEADPSVVNLTSVETFYPEHRPFFLDGAGTFRFAINCPAFLCANDQLFYSRRIGRAPQLASTYGASSETAAPILAAAKVTGQASGNVNSGALGAATGRVTSLDGHTTEPATAYGAARLVAASSDGRSGATLVATIVDRSLDDSTNPYLARSA